jgi:hypothetical protein
VHCNCSFFSFFPIKWPLCTATVLFFLFFSNQVAAVHCNRSFLSFFPIKWPLCTATVLFFFFSNQVAAVRCKWLECQCCSLAWGLVAASGLKNRIHLAYLNKNRIHLALFEQECILRAGWRLRGWLPSLVSRCVPVLFVWGSGIFLLPF